MLGAIASDVKLLQINQLKLDGTSDKATEENGS
jgi:hypothetical protein